MRHQGDEAEPVASPEPQKLPKYHLANLLKREGSNSSCKNGMASRNASTANSVAKTT